MSQVPRKRGTRTVRPASPSPIPAARPNPGRTRRNLPPEGWRGRILQAARLLLAEGGYRAMTMEEIARVAGVSRARLYSFFPRRRDVISAILTQEARSLVGEAVLEMSSTTTMQDKVTRLVSVFFDFVERRRQGYRVLYTYGDPADTDEEEVLRGARGALADTLTRQPAAPGESHEEAMRRRLMAHSVLAMIEGGATAWVGSRVPRARAVEIVRVAALNALDLPDGSDGAATGIVRRP